MGAFRISPEYLTSSGQKLVDNAAEFKTNSDNIFKTVEEMVQSDYVSPDAKAIAEKIFSYRDELTNMYNTIGNYGRFCENSATKMTQTQDDIISTVM